MHQCDENEIALIIKLLNPNKASGPSSIDTKVLLLLKDKISNPLSKLFNLSFSTGVHPNMFKISKTIPIFIKGSRTAVSNYRPISLLSNLNNIIEKLVF